MSIAITNVTVLDQEQKTFRISFSATLQVNGYNVILEPTNQNGIPINGVDPISFTTSSQYGANSLFVVGSGQEDLISGYYRVSVSNPMVFPTPFYTGGGVRSGAVNLNFGTNYTIEYNANAGGDPTVASMPTKLSSTYVGLTRLSAAVPTRTGYRFKGWLNTSGVTFQPDTLYTAGASIVLSAQWAQVYTVTYDGNGGTAPVDSNQYEMGDSAAIAFSSALRPHFRLTGWNTAADGTGTAYTTPGDTLTIAGNIILYAQWTPVVTVSYASNGGSIAISDETLYDPNSNVVVKFTPTPTRANYRFTGWNTVENGSGTSYTTTGATIFLDEDKTLYAQWIPTFTITYAGNGGSTTATDSTVYDLGASVSVLFPDPSPSRTYYDFAGWNTAANGSGASYTATGTTSFSISQNTTLYAQWTPIPQYTLTYNKNGGTGTVPSPASPYGGIPWSVASNTLTKLGVSFAGWCTDPSGNGTLYRSDGENSTITITGNTTLYAVWGHSITFENSSPFGISSIGFPEDTICPVGKSITVPFTATHPICSLDGWTIGTRRINPTDSDKSFTPMSIMKVLPVWTQTHSIVRYRSGVGIGATTLNTQYVPYNSPTSVDYSDPPTQTGRVFVGWRDSFGTGVYYALENSTLTTSRSQLDLYPILVPLTTNIRYNSIITSRSVSLTVPTNTYFTPTFDQGFTREGFKLSGWKRKSNNDIFTPQSNPSILAVFDTGFDALWASAGKVIYNANGLGAICDISDNDVYVANDTVSVKFTPAPTRAGYTFAGWTQAVSGTGTLYSEGGTTSFPMVITPIKGGFTIVNLYAKWVVDPSAPPAEVVYAPPAITSISVSRPNISVVFTCPTANGSDIAASQYEIMFDSVTSDGTLLKKGVRFGSLITNNSSSEITQTARIFAGYYKFQVTATLSSGLRLTSEYSSIVNMTSAVYAASTTQAATTEVATAYTAGEAPEALAASVFTGPAAAVLPPSSKPVEIAAKTLDILSTGGAISNVADATAAISKVAELTSPTVAVAAGLVSEIKNKISKTDLTYGVHDLTVNSGTATKITLPSIESAAVLDALASNQKSTVSPPLSTVVVNIVPPPVDPSDNSTPIEFTVTIGSSTLTATQMYTMVNDQDYAITFINTLQTPNVAETVTINRSSSGAYITVTRQSGGSPVQLTLTNNSLSVAGVNLKLSTLGATGFLFEEPPSSGAVCFLGSAPVLTPGGYRRIDSLAVGDLVCTADGREVAVQRVKHQRIERPSAAVNPYVIPAGLFGATENLLISPRHCVAVPGRGMVEARELGLKQMPMRAAFDYYNLELPEWDNMIVAGVEVESLAPKKQVVMTVAQMAKLIVALPAERRAAALGKVTALADGRVVVQMNRKERRMRSL